MLRALHVRRDVIVSPLDLGSPPPQPEETGSSYEMNAILKGLAFSRWAGMPALADDSGLEVESLQGRPGVHSARFAGPGATDEGNRRRLLSELDGVPDENRGARFVAVIVLCDGDRVLYRVRGECEGWITHEARGTGGFGYDPLFIPAGGRLTFAELPPHDKDRVSHRGRALRQLRQDLAAGVFPLPLADAADDSPPGAPHPGCLGWGGHQEARPPQGLPRESGPVHFENENEH